MKGKMMKEYKFKKINHIKNASEDFNNSSNSQNFFISKFLNHNNTIKNEMLTEENLPNLKTNIQNIFSNEDTKQRALQYLIKIRKDRNSSPSTDFNKILTSETSREKRINKQEKGKEIKVSPFNNINEINNKNIKKQVINSYNLNQKKSEINPKVHHRINKTSINFNDYIFEELPVNIINKEKKYKYNNYIQLNNINYNNKNHSPQAINNYSFNNIFNNKAQININQNDLNKKYDSLLNIKNNKLNNYESTINSPTIKNNPFENYMKNYNIFKIRNKILSLQNNKNEKISINNNNINKSFFINNKPNPIYTKINIKNNHPERNNLNTNSNIVKRYKYKDYILPKKSIYKIGNNKIQINKTNYDLEKTKKIFDDSRGMFKKFNNNNLSKINSIQIDIIGKRNKLNRRIDNNSNSKFNKEKLIINGNIKFNINNDAKNKFKFNNDEEIIEYFKKNYDKEKLKHMFELENNENRILKVNKIDNDEDIKKLGEIEREKEKQELYSEIKKLKHENKLYKKELVDVRNQFNDLSKELVAVKEENEKLKDNIINNMLNDVNINDLGEENK